MAYTIHYKSYTHRCPSCQTIIAIHDDLRAYVETPFKTCRKCGREVVVTTCTEWELLSDSSRGQYWITQFYAAIGVPVVCFILVGIATAAAVKWIGGGTNDSAVATGAIAGASASVLGLMGTIWSSISTVRKSKGRMSDPDYRQRVLDLQSPTSGQSTSPEIVTSPAGERRVDQARLHESQRRTKKGLVVVLGALGVLLLLRFGLLAGVSPLLHIVAGGALVAGSFFCLQGAIQRTGAVTMAMGCFALAVLYYLLTLSAGLNDLLERIYYGSELGFRVMGFGFFTYYLCAWELDNKPADVNPGRFILIPTAFFLYGVALHAQPHEERIRWISLLIYLAVACMAWVRFSRLSPAPSESKADPA